MNALPWGSMSLVNCDWVYHGLKSSISRISYKAVGENRHQVIYVLENMALNFEYEQMFWQLYIDVK